MTRVFASPPTVQHELANWALRGAGLKRESARKAIRLGQFWRIVPVNLIAAGHGIAERIAERVREEGLMPEEEVNDSLVLAESALLGCSMLLTSDEHLRGIDFERLTMELQNFDLTAPVIATPREIVQKFFSVESLHSSTGTTSLLLSFFQNSIQRQGARPQSISTADYANHAKAIAAKESLTADRRS